MKSLVLSPALWLLSVPLFYAQSFNGLYEGEWKSPDGHEFRFVLDLEEINHSVKGNFVWSFEKAPDSDTYYFTKSQGTTAKEFIAGKVAGKYQLEFAGTYRVDPDQIISLDKYRLTFNEDYSYFTGRTENNGTWKGKIEGRKVQLN